MRKKTTPGCDIRGFTTARETYQEPSVGAGVFASGSQAQLNVVLFLFAVLLAGADAVPPS